MRPLLIAVVVLAVLFRLVLLAQNVSHNPLATVPMVDAALHHETAQRIAGGEVVQPGPLTHPPLYAYFLALIYSMAGPSPETAAFVQALLGAAGLWLLFRLARQNLGIGPSAAAVVLAAFYGPLALIEQKLLPASLSALLVLVLLNFLIDWLKNGGARRIMLSGIAGGLLVLDRPNMIFLPLLITGWLLMRRIPGSRKGAVVFAAAFAAALLPCFVHNLAAGDGSLPVCGGGGLNFYLGNRQEAEVSFMSGGSEFSDPAGMPERSAALYEAERGEPPHNLAALERFWFAKGLKEISADPGAWLWLELRKLGALLSDFEYGVNCNYESEKDLMGVLSFFVIPFWLLAGLGIAGLFASRKEPGSPGGNVARMPLLLVLASVALSALVFFTYSRFRIPAVPVLALLGAGALRDLIAAVKERKPGLVFRLALPALLAAVISLLPQGEVARKQESGGHALVGAAFFRTRDLDKACRAYERAVAVDPASVKALQTWASVLVADGRHGEAWNRHRRALEIAPRDPEVLVNSAMFLTTAPEPFRDPVQAVELAREAEESAPDMAFATLCLGMAYHLCGDEEKSRAKLREAIEKSGRSPRVMKVLEAWRGDNTR